MNASRFLPPVLALTILSASQAAEVVYRPPNPPPANAAAVPSSRADDWLIMVQNKFTKYGNKQADIVFDGDSITNRWEGTGAEMWKRYSDRAADFGIEADQTQHLLWRLSKGQLDKVNPKVVVLMIGTNNASRDHTPAQIAGGVKAVVEEYLRLAPKAHIILMGVFPRGQTPDNPMRLKVAEVNDLIKTLDDGKRVTYVDIGPKLIEPNGEISAEMMPDFLHPTAQGYVIWADAIQPLIDKYAPSKK